MTFKDTTALNAERDPEDIRAEEEIEQFSGYKRVDVYAAQDHRLIPLARAIIFYLVSKPPRWIFRMADIEREFGLGREAWRTVRDNLQNCGYLNGGNQPDPVTRQMRWRWQWRSRPVEARIPLGQVSGRPTPERVDTIEQSLELKSRA